MQQQKSFTCSLGNSAIDNLPIAPERATALTLGLLAGDPGVRMMTRTAETFHIDKQDCCGGEPLGNNFDGTRVLNSPVKLG